MKRRKLKSEPLSASQGSGVLWIYRWRHAPARAEVPAALSTARQFPEQRRRSCRPQTRRQCYVLSVQRYSTHVSSALRTDISVFKVAGLKLGLVLNVTPELSPMLQQKSFTLCNM